jgi:hypothetical protein
LTALGTETPDSFAVTVLAVVEYRAGKMKDALARIEPLANDDTAPRPAAWAVCAAIHAAEGRPDAAKPYRTKCDEWLATQDPAAPPSWELRLAVRCLK